METVVLKANQGPFRVVVDESLNLTSEGQADELIITIPEMNPGRHLFVFHHSRSGETITLEADICRDDSINTLFTELSAQGVKVLSMRNKTNRLEELFMNLVENASGDRAAP